MNTMKNWKTFFHLVVKVLQKMSKSMTKWLLKVGIFIEVEYTSSCEI